ncbi:MAG TPA: polymer-forming cytoskeletal protein [Ktedonobacterales bacterium]|nr:polymer-forming cytoskeletal protein [Ktedonobacterales bacterium]
MRRRRPVLLWGAAFLFLCLCCALAIGTGVFFSFSRSCSQGNAGSSVTVPQGQNTDDVRACGGSVTVLGHVTGDVTDYGGRIMVAESGRVDGDIQSYGGSVEIAGVVGGDVKSYGGRITLDDSAQVGGDVVAYGGGIGKASAARVDGDIRHDDAPGSGLNWLPLSNPFSFSFPIVPMIFGGLLAAALAHWMPVRTWRVGEVMFGALPRSLAIGALSWVLGIILAVILALTIIGIVATIAIVLALIAGWVVGSVAVGWLLGRAILQRIGSREHSPVVEAVVGVVILALLEAVPVVGPLLTLFIAVVGVGAAFLSHFGARRWRPFSSGRWAA